MIWYASRLATASSLPNLFVDQKQKLPISRRQSFEPPPILVDKNGINDPLTKRQPSQKKFPHENDASTWKAIYDMRRCSKQKSHEETKKKNKKKLIVMSCT